MRCHGANPDLSESPAAVGANPNPSAVATVPATVLAPAIVGGGRCSLPLAIHAAGAGALPRARRLPVGGDDVRVHGDWRIVVAIAAADAGAFVCLVVALTASCIAFVSPLVTPQVVEPKLA